MLRNGRLPSPPSSVTDGSSTTPSSPASPPLPRRAGFKYALDDTFTRGGDRVARWAFSASAVRVLWGSSVLAWAGTLNGHRLGPAEASSLWVAACTARLTAVEAALCRSIGRLVRRTIVARVVHCGLHGERVSP